MTDVTTSRAQAPGAATAARPAVIFDNVSIVFGDKPETALPMMDAGKERSEIQAETGQTLGVHDCSIEVKQGQILVLMGLSGSGKSTLIRAVNGLNPVVRGRVLIDGGDGSDDMVDVTHANRRTLRNIRRHRVAMVFQQFGLLPWRRVLDNVAFGLELEGRPRAEREAKAREQLELVGLQDWADSRVSELSGGMQQRVGLARAFATEAPILLMDEPFSALDPLIRTRLQDELCVLQRQLNRTVIFVSHDLDEAFKLGDHIAIMEGGRVVQHGAPQDIARAPATEYVKAFVSNMNPLGVLQAEDMMIMGTATPGAPEVAHDAPASEVVQAAAATDGPLTVTRDGQVVGVIDARDVLAALGPAAEAETGEPRR